jgi:type I restriction enzyme, S subunit
MNIERIPPRWQICKLRDVATIITGNTPPKDESDNYGNQYPWVKPPDLESKIPITQTKEYLSDKGAKKARLLPPKTVLVSCIGILGKVGLAGTTLATNQQINAVIFKNIVIPEYGFYFCKTLKEWLENNSSSTTVSIINKERFSEAPFTLPPLNEQHRIVAKLEVLLGKVDGCQNRLEKIPRILKRFRQSVLAAACDGRLTADWRERNKDVGLLESDFDIPQKWKRTDVSKVIQNLKYGTAQKCDYEKKGFPVLRIPNIVEQFIDHSDLKYTELNEKEYEQLKLIPGDILLIRSNGSVSLVGKTAIVRESEQGFAYAGYLIRIRPNKNIVLPEYLNLALSTHDVRLQIEIPARSTSGVNNINSDEVKALNFNLPPLAEQQEIVWRVESLFKLADQLEARYQKAKSYVDKLTQSILAKAFRGELVAQDPNDEPASVLLERIKQEKEAVTTGKTRKASVKSKVANKKEIVEITEVKEIIIDKLPIEEKFNESIEEKISSSLDKMVASVEKLGEQMTLPFMENEK